MRSLVLAFVLSTLSTLAQAPVSDASQFMPMPQGNATLEVTITNGSHRPYDLLTVGGGQAAQLVNLPVGSSTTVMIPTPADNGNNQCHFTLQLQEGAANEPGYYVSNTLATTSCAPTTLVVTQ